MSITNYIKRFVPTLILLLLSTLSLAIEKPSRSEVSFARHFAEEFLYDKGATVNMSLQLEEYTEHLFFFNDIDAEVFLLMARDDYASLLNDQVLAFSIGVWHSKARENMTFMHMFAYYDNLIKDMHEGRIPKEQPSERPNIFIRPMLSSIRWYQARIGKIYDDHNRPCLYGCGAVAVGQLMKYHEWPDKAKGEFCYMDDAKKLRSINLEGATIPWGKLNNVYNFFYPHDTALDTLMKRVGHAICSEYGYEGTSSNSRDFKRAMVRNFGYSPAMFLVNSLRVNEYTMVNLIRNDLNQGCPCILTGGHHVFVCDGMYADFLHLNMGWGGSYDGWYRFPIVRKDINEYSFINSALLNIFPDDAATHINRTVTIETPGTLSSLLSEKDYPNISSLKIIGKINGADIRLIRRMAGGYESCDYFSWKGILSSLDLSEATIVTDSIPYINIDAGSINFKMNVKGKLYEFANMTDSDWEAFCATKANNDREYRITRDDSIYHLRPKTISGQIGMYMFEACENLRQIILPKNTYRISPRAFSGCYALEEITLPPGVRNIDAKAFEHCMSLEKVTVCNDSPMLYMQQSVGNANNTIFYGCNPKIRMVVDTSMQTYADYTSQQEELRNAKREQEYVRARAEADKKVLTYTNKKKDTIRAPMGTKVISTYKMVNGKRVLVRKKTVKI